jgi:hypothetical protein
MIPLKCSPVPIVFLTIVGLAAVLFIAGGTSQAETAFNWKGGPGLWEYAALWGGTVPAGTAEARINGTKEKPSEVTLTSTDALVNHLSIADDSGSAASLMLDGSSLTVPGTVDVGKYDGSDGRFVIKSGNVFASTIFVSGGGGPGMRGRGTIEIRGGTLVTKDIELGVSAGCHSVLHIIGSKCSGMAVEDGLHIGVYNYLSLEKQPPPSVTDLIFDLDADGVTPVFTWGRTAARGITISLRTCSVAFHAGETSRFNATSGTTSFMIGDFIPATATFGR